MGTTLMGMEFREWLAQAFARTGKDRADLESALGGAGARNTVGSWVSGRSHPRHYDHMLTLSDVFGVSIAEVQDAIQDSLNLRAAKALASPTPPRDGDPPPILTPLELAAVRALVAALGDLSVADIQRLGRIARCLRDDDGAA